MSHTTIGAEATFIHNGDFSGDITISSKKTNFEPVRNPDGDYIDLTIPFEDLKMIVATYVRDKNISALEQASDDDDVLFMEWSVNE